jgi:hypothetical protein
MSNTDCYNLCLLCDTDFGSMQLLNFIELKSLVLRCGDPFKAHSTSDRRCAARTKLRTILRGR